MTAATEGVLEFRWVSPAISVASTARSAGVGANCDTMSQRGRQGDRRESRPAPMRTATANVSTRPSCWSRNPDRDHLAGLGAISPTLRATARPATPGMSSARIHGTTTLRPHEAIFFRRRSSRSCPRWQVKVWSPEERECDEHPRQREVNDHAGDVSNPTAESGRRIMPRYAKSAVAPVRRRVRRHRRTTSHLHAVLGRAGSAGA